MPYKSYPRLRALSRGRRYNPGKYARRIQRAWRRRRRRRGNLKYKVRKISKIVYKDIEHRWQDDMSYSETIPGAGGSGVQIGLDTISTQPTGPLTNDDRLGNKITLKKFYLKGQLIQADSHNFCRLILAEVVSLAQIVVTADILQPDPVSGNPTIYSPYRKESRIKFKVLLDKFYKLVVVLLLGYM